ncbi:hypothetical protein, partial [Kitasatospora sp. NPDC056181]|uniref:hypothetical protein n=1 Tax=Kitasatospora sp. NPDC056181 TaxID=3345737 RepID=UPI0035D6F19B
PFEIRTMGSPMKSWDELKTELRDLAGWAEEAYRHDRAPAGDTARRRTGTWRVPVRDAYRPLRRAPVRNTRRSARRAGP